jgi:imidazolonepropionase-like amidohydrolase
VVTRESAALAAWYASRPEIRRLWAVKDTLGLRVLVHVERAPDSNEIHPAWMANRNVWTDELQLGTGSTVRLEHADGLLGDEVMIDAQGVTVAALSWRDPSFS